MDCDYELGYYVSVHSSINCRLEKYQPNIMRRRDIAHQTAIFWGYKPLSLYL